MWHIPAILSAAVIGVIAAAPVLAQDAFEPGLPGATAPTDADDILGQVQAQMPPGQTTSQPQTPIVVLNQDRFLAGTAYGQRIQVELDAASRDLATENREIEARLTEEELRLTELRPTMTPEDFRVLADEFDARVEAIRSAQEAKSRSLQGQADQAQSQFFELAFPILLTLVQDRGAAVLMDSRGVLLAADAVDITDDAMARFDAEIGDGGPEPLIAINGGTPDTPPTQRP